VQKKTETEFKYLKITSSYSFCIIKMAVQAQHHSSNLLFLNKRFIFSL